MATSPLEPGQIVAGRYRVESQIGVGGMGVVYLVHHVHTDERLAMKVLHAQVLRDEGAVERFRREARAPARVASEHVCRVTDADTAAELGGAPFYVMEYLQGKDLERIIVEGGPIGPELAVEYLRQAARALDKAHGMGVVHRDLKPENLFLTRREDDSPCIKLLDFGIARLAASELPAHLKTQAGAMFGTPAYMSPEQMEGDLERVGAPADIWALGLIAFKLLVGQDFWTGNTVAVLCAQVLSIPKPTPTVRGSTYGARFDEWFATCVARDPKDRYKTAGEAVTALAAALGVRLEIRRSSVSMVALHEAPTELGAGLEVARDEAVRAPSPTSTIHGVAPPAAASRPGVAIPTPAPSAPRQEPTVPSDLPIGAGTIAPTSTSEDVAGRRLRVRAFVGVIALVLVASAVIVALVSPGGSTSAASTGSAAQAGLDAAPTGKVEGSPTGAAIDPPAPSSATPPGPALSAESSAAAGTPSAPAALTGRLPSGTAQAWPKPGESKPPEAPPPPPASTAPPPPPPPPPPAETTKPKGNSGAPSADQKKRLSSLQRLCDQGIYTPAECAAKRQAILSGGP